MEFRPGGKKNWNGMEMLIIFIVRYLKVSFNSINYLIDNVQISDRINVIPPISKLKHGNRMDKFLV